MSLSRAAGGQDAPVMKSWLLGRRPKRGQHLGGSSSCPATAVARGGSTPRPPSGAPNPELGSGVEGGGSRPARRLAGTRATKVGTSSAASAGAVVKGLAFRRAHGTT